MAITGYGTDILALEDLPDPERMGTGAIVVAYAIGRRLLTPAGGLADVGDEAQYASVDLRGYLGRRVNAADIKSLESQVEAVATEDPRVESATSSVTFADRRLSVRIDAVGTEGPFRFVLSVDDVSSSLLMEF